MFDIKKTQSLIFLAGIIMFLVIIDSQCYSYQDACLPGIGFVTTAPTVFSDQKLLLDSLSHNTISPEWKEKIGNVYALIGLKAVSGNYHTFPIISSIVLLIVTYFFALKITQNRLSSIIAVIVLMASKTFLYYSDSIPYPNLFLSLLLLSIYPFTKVWLKPLAFITSFIFKAEALAFLPLVFIREQNKRIRIVYLILGVLIASFSVLMNWVRFDGTINYANLLSPMISIDLLIQDMWILYTIVPVTGLLFYLRYKKIDWSSFLLIAMGYCLLFQYVLPIFTTYGGFGYRMLPFVVFFALSVSLIISKKDLLLENIWKKDVPINP